MKSGNATQVFAFSLLGLCSFVVIAPVLVIVGILLYKGASAISWSFLTTMPSGGMREGGIFPAIVGTLWLVAGTIIVALPLGVAAAIYLTEYAKRGPLTRIIRLAIVNLAGVPSVVYGLFGLGVFVYLLKLGTSVIAGALTLAVMVLPVIITTAEEALLSVPMSFREASLGLGATKWQTVWQIVLPGALPGIITGGILGIGRAAGETAPILFTAAAFFLPRLPHSIFDQVMALPYHLYAMTTQVPNAPDSMRYGTALTLIALVLALNLGASALRARFRRDRKW